MTVSAGVQSRSIVLDVRGLPRPQGSLLTHLTPNGKVALRSPGAVVLWRRQVQAAVMELQADPFNGPVEVRLGFDFARPAAHFGTGRNAGIVKASAPPFPITRAAGDIDKLARAILDSITDAGLWGDDSQVVTIVASKRYASPAGVHIKIIELVNYQP